MPVRRTPSGPAAKAPPHRIPEGSLLPLWRRINHAFASRGQRWGLPLNAVMALVHLHLHPESAEPAVLADATHFARQTMTFVLDTLEERGLASRAPHPSDRRRKRIELTKAGHALATKVVDDLLVFEAGALAALPAGSLQTFRKLVGCYADALARQSGGTPLAKG
jgi:DNA-binding MarR family transcriptional regulator